MAGLLKQLFGPRQIVPRQTLPTEHWVTIKDVGRMNLVWPWYAVDDPQPLVDDRGRDVGVTPALEIHAARTTQDASLIAWSDAGTGTVAGAEWAGSIARLHQGKLARNAPFALGGAVGHFAQVTVGPTTTFRMILPRYSTTVQIEATVPTPHSDAYWVQIESMLATWGWDD